MPIVKEYEKQVYASVLGKIIGVYMGRPFEGWSKAKLEEKWGRVDRYVHEDQKVDLVVSDDDITGTFTFIRALEDSGDYANTSQEFMGDNWLNYLIEKKTILWWGGMGHSTEHTAYLRLKNGVKAPESGSIALNGKTVAEQIGAQIFIDAFGMVAPGKPELAADLAKKAARVSHDGEAVHAAVVVAGMVSAAFVEKDMNKLLDIGVSLIPENSLIAKVHKDVRSWAKKDKDWRKTYERIDKKYGYHKYGGNCHVIPNHALMVMAWVYAPDDFHESQVIINTAGWDTDCNAANVGSVMGVVVGLDRICEKYDFRSPFADRLILPTAEGTRSISDALTESLHIAGIGRRIMGWPSLEKPKSGAWHHFSMPGALHGYMSEEKHFESRGTTRVSNTAEGKARCMKIDFKIDAGSVSRTSTPIIPKSKNWGYNNIECPSLYPGMVVKLQSKCVTVEGTAQARLFIRSCDENSPYTNTPYYGKMVRLEKGKPVDLALNIPELDGWAVEDLGIEIFSKEKATGAIAVDRVELSGKPLLSFPASLKKHDNGNIAGWIADSDFSRGMFSDDPEEVTRIGKNEGRGLLVTGTRYWSDYTFSTRMSVHLADKAGILVHYQGQQRYIALIKSGDKLQLVRKYYCDEVLAETACKWKVDELHAVSLVCKGKAITAYADGKKLFSCEDVKLGCGGAGFLFENGIIAFRDVRIG